MAATYPFYNRTVGLNDLWWESHATLLSMVATELGEGHKIEELTEKFLGTQRKVKKQKDPAYPKRARSAYIYFTKEYRPKVVKKLTKAKKPTTIKEVSQELSSAWAKLKNRQVYDKMAEKDRNRYESEIAKYKEENNY